ARVDDAFGYDLGRRAAPLIHFDACALVAGVEPRLPAIGLETHDAAVRRSLAPQRFTLHGACADKAEENESVHPPSNVWTRAAICTDVDSSIAFGVEAVLAEPLLDLL